VDWLGHIDRAVGHAARLKWRAVAVRKTHGHTVLTVLRGTAAALVLLLVSSGEIAPEQDIHCLALNIYFEARNEPEDGRRAVAHVVLNRVADRRWPDNACAVIAQGWPEAGPLCQFSWYCDGRPDIPRAGAHWQDANRLAERVFWGRSDDPTGGAFWYHADYVSPWWSEHLRRGRKIGRHIFYHDPAKSAPLEKQTL
jgi:spore germination cell wall hydrolase CwlJ-like protein